MYALSQKKNTIFYPIFSGKSLYDPPPPRTLYEVNFILHSLDSNSSLTGFSLVEDHLLYPYYKFKYPQVPV